MSANIKQFILRCLWLPVGGIFFLHEFELMTRVVNDFVFDFTYDLTGAPIFLTLNRRLDVVSAFLIVWALAHFCLETGAAFGTNFRFQRLLKTLRYAPLAVFLTAATVVVFYDLGRIEYSKHEIRNYLSDTSTKVQKPDIYLHNNYYGWRADGYQKQEKNLYFQTALNGFESENPFVRARSLLMTARIQDWQSGSDAIFDIVLARGCMDPYHIVRDAAENYFYRRNSTCQKYLSSR